VKTKRMLKIHVFRLLRKLSETLVIFGYQIRKLDRTYSGNFYRHDLSSQIPNISEIQEKFLGRKNNGFFIEVGAYDGKQFGSVWGLVKRNWDGILIEPLPENVAKIKANYNNYNNVIIVECAVSDREKKLKMYHNAQLSGVTDSRYKIGIKSSTVKAYTLDSICKHYKVKQGFDLLTVDVEGHEKEVLSGFNLNIWRPKMIIMELSDSKIKNRNISQHKEILLYIVKQNKYVVVYKDWINTVFVRRDVYLSK